MIDIEGIQDVLPHRYPFLLVDRITEMEENCIKGYKNISMNEAVFQGHFPGHAIFPGVLICEAMAQLGGVLLLQGDNKGKLAYFAGLDNVRFRRPVVPGDRLDMQINVISFRHNLGRVKAMAMVDGELACEADLTCKVVDR
ncbi:MAG: 3-hydroxyacyl-ACP dehydratase FabZ [Abditibacteriota bacterium]|nr:3-hydroxyacyl-ACP dehydratase FabZ [Abditibacteriota bacterium]